MPNLRSWIEDYRRWGVSRTLHKRFMLAIRPHLVLCRVHSRPLSSQPPKPPPTGFEARIVREGELMAASADEQLGLSADFVRSALARGDVCIGAFHDGRMVSYVWRSFTCAPHTDGLWVRFRKPFRYGYKAFTLPEFRGRHLQDPLARLLDAYCIERGFAFSIGFVETHNYPSIASDERRGSRLLGWVGYLKLFGRTVTFRSPGAARCGFGFFVAADAGVSV